MIALYHQTKTPISFRCRWGLNPIYLIQLSETLPVELIRTHQKKKNIKRALILNLNIHNALKEITHTTYQISYHNIKGNK